MNLELINFVSRGVPQHSNNKFFTPQQVENLPVSMIKWRNPVKIFSSIKNKLTERRGN